MRYRLIGITLVILFTFAAFAAAQAQEVIYLIRHADQELDVEDPPLTQAGHERANAWAGLLREANIKVIYTSNKRRTKQTGETIARTLNIPLETMARRDAAGLVERLRTRHADDAALIVGHRFTIPKLLEALGHSGDVAIQQDDYGNLFIVVPESESGPLVLRLRYP